MSFDLHFQPCRYDGTTKQAMNPFTNELAAFPNNAPLTKGEVDAVVRILEDAGAKRDTDGTFTLRASDGTSFEMYGAIEDGCMISIRGAGITPTLAKLLFDVLVAGNWVLLSDPSVIAANASALQGMPDDGTFDDVVIVTSPDQVKTLLIEGWKTFEKYAAKVVS
ncbi:MAG: hypothetical protein ABI551_15550 [Polyangiaceae bacterium]